MIKNIKLENIVAFRKISLDFSPKVNIIIGENGTGKTQLMKLAYAISKITSPDYKDAVDLKSVTTELLLNLFNPIENKIGKLWHKGSSSTAKAAVEFSNESTVKLEFNYNSKNVDIDCGKSDNLSAVFIPTKEILSLLKGIQSVESDLSVVKNIFDQTYIDLLENVLINAEANIDERISSEPRFGTIYPKLVDIIGGKYIFEDNDFKFQSGGYLEKKKRFNVKHAGAYADITECKFKKESSVDDMSVLMTAEGFRKIGIIQRLLENKRLDSRVCQTLFWDEPEANLNPNLMKQVVQTILELSRNGMQIIISTHDYTTLKWFDILADNSKDDHVKYHHIYRSEDNYDLHYEAHDNYLSITPNEITKTFQEIIEYEVKKSMQGLGK